MLNRRQAILAALASAGTFGSPRSGYGAEVEVGLSEQRNRYMLEVALNGQGGFQFLFDTGATAHFVADRVVRRQALPVVSRRQVRGYAGAEQTRVVSVTKMAVGPQVLGRVEAVAWPDERLSPHDGLVGYPLLMPQAVLDFPAGKLRLGGAAPDGLAPVRAQVMRNQTLLIGGVAGVDGRYLFDSGAQAFTLAPDHFARIEASEAFKAANKLVYRTDDGQSHTAAFRPSEVAFGDLRIADPIVRVARADGREGVFHGVDGLFGVSLMRRLVWSIDPVKGRLLASSPAAATPAAWFGAGVLVRPEAFGLRVRAVQPGGAADEAGVGPGALIVEVDGEPAGRADWNEASASRRRELLIHERGQERGRPRRIALETRPLL